MERDADQPRLPDCSGRPRRSRVVVLPFAGVHSFVGTPNDGYARSVGASTGVLLGFHLSPVFSLAGELSFDLLNFKNTPSDPSGIAFVMAVVPQFHIVAPTFEIIVGPKIGLWFEEIDGIDPNFNYEKRSTSASGLVVGLNAGIFFPVGRHVSVGGLLTFDLRPFNRICTNTNTTSESCSDSSLPDSLKLWGLAAALLF